MAFGDNTRPANDKSGTTSTSTGESNYLRLAGEQVIRILDKSEDVPFYWRYYMWVNVGGKQQERSITVGRTGPIRDWMSSIGDSDRRFRKPGKRMMLNVLDRTPNESGQPENKVKILDFGSDLLSKFTTLHNRVRNQKTFEPMAVWDFDLQVISIPGKEPKDVQRNVLPGMDQDPLPEDLQALLKFDLTQAARPMPDEMQRRLIEGEDLLEILRELGWQRLEPTIKQ